MQQPSETRTIWHTRNDELEPSPHWGLSCLYEYDFTKSIEDKDFIRKLMAKALLTPREQKVIHLCIFDGYSLEDVATRLDSWEHTRERIRQIRMKALQKLIDAAHKLT